MLKSNGKGCAAEVHEPASRDFSIASASSRPGCQVHIDRVRTARASGLMLGAVSVLHGSACLLASFLSSAALVHYRPCEVQLYA